MLLPLLLYGALAALALWATWRDIDLRWVGLWLAGGFISSNVLFFSVPIFARVGPYTFIEVLVAVAAMGAWLEHRYRALAVLVAVNLVSIGFNVVFALNDPPSRWQIYLWEVSTNLCFATECLLAIGVGIAHGYRTGRFSRRLHLRRHDAQPDIVREGEP